MRALSPPRRALEAGPAAARKERARRRQPAPPPAAPGAAPAAVPGRRAPVRAALRPARSPARTAPENKARSHSHAGTAIPRLGPPRRAGKLPHGRQRSRSCLSLRPGHRSARPVRTAPARSGVKPTAPNIYVELITIEMVSALPSHVPQF